MRKLVMSFLVGLLCSSSFAFGTPLTEDERTQAAQEVEKVFRGTVNLATQPYNQKRYDEQIDLFWNHLYLGEEKNGSNVFGKDWDAATDEDKRLFLRTATLFVSESLIVSGARKAANLLRTDLVKYAKNIGLDQAQVEMWAANPAELPVRVEPVNREENDKESLLRFRVIILPEVVDLYREGKTHGVDVILPGIVFYVSVVKGKSNFHITNIYQPHSAILRHNSTMASNLIHLVRASLSSGGDFASAYRRNKDFQKVRPDISKVRFFANWVMAEYEKRFAKR